MLSMKISAAILLSICAAFLCACDKTPTYKVGTSNGVPRLEFDGKPVRARMLYVSMPDFKIFPPKPEFPFLESSAKDFSIPFKSGAAARTLRVIFKPDARNAGFEISKLEVRETPSGKTVFSARLDAQNPRIKSVPSEADAPEFAGGAVKIAARGDGKSAGIAFGGIKTEADRQYEILIRAKTDSAPFTLRCEIADSATNKPLPLAPKLYIAEQVKLAKSAGIDIITFPLQAESFYDGETPDFGAIDRSFQAVLTANPDAKILPRIRFYPSPKWLAANPDSALTFSDGKRSAAFAAVSSEKYREQSRRALETIIDYAEARYGKNIIGYHPAGGNSCEWFYGNSHTVSPFAGYDASTAKAWNKWLLKNYPSDAVLRAAWNDNSASRASAKVPTQDERVAPDFLINPQTQMRLADFNKFRQDEITDTMLELAAVVKGKVPNKLSVFFYGYTIGFSGCYNGAANTGHYMFEKLLHSGLIDVYCGPNSYWDRYFGDGQLTNTVPETIARHGKFWIDEDDIRTHLAVRREGAKPCGIEGAKTPEECRSILFRCMAHQAARNNGSWWMDLTGRGWYADPELWKIMESFGSVETDMLENPSPYSPEVAIIFGEESSNYLAPQWRGGNFAAEYARATRYYANKSSATYGSYLLRDTLEKPLNAKLLVYAAAYALDKSAREKIFEMSRKTPSIFVWATGYIDTDARKFSTDAIREATGFEVENAQDGTLKAHYVATPEGEKIGLPKDSRFYDRKRAYSPAFSPVLRDGDRVFATFENGKPAIVLRGKNLFCGFGFVPKEVYAEMYRIAGVHRYADIPCSVRANGKYLSVVPVDIPRGKTAKITITPKGGKTIYDAVSGRKLADGKLEASAKRGDVFFLRAE